MVHTQLTAFAKTTFQKLTSSPEMRTKLVFLTATILFVTGQAIGQRGIGTNNPSPSAALEVASTNKGMLIPRMTTAQRNAIATPAEGLRVYDTNTQNFWYYDGSAWVNEQVAANNNPWDNTDGSVANQSSTDINYQGGNVGIGQTAGTLQLEVNGALHVGTYTSFVGGTYSNESVFQAGSNEAGRGFVQTPWLYSHAIEAPNEKGAAGTGIFIGEDGRFNTNDDQISLVTSGNQRLFIQSNGNTGIGTITPTSRLEINGRTTTTNFTMTNGATNGYVLQSNATGVATWVDPATLAVTGDNLGNHTATTNLDMNSRDIVFTTGNQSMPTGNLDFGSTTRQMVNLWGGAGEFGIGVQSSTQYFRSNNNFAWFRGGVHSNTAYDPGAGGNRLMALNNSGLEVQARTTTTNFTMTNGATNGYVLQSNAAGDASWVDPTTFSAANIYNTNGTLTGNRAVTQNNFDLNFDANTLVVDGSANRVGIGTAAPDGKLNINSNGIGKGLNIDTDQDSRGAITIRRTDNANEIGVGFQNSGNGYGSVIFHRDQNDTDDLDEALSIATIGNETNPALLGETATFKNDGTIRFHNYGTGANDDASPARILGVQADGDLIEVNSSTLTQNIYNTDGTLTGNRAVTLGTNDLNFDANTLVVSGDDDRIGIGTSSPTEKLQVSNGVIYANGEGSGLIVDNLNKRVGLMKYSGKEAGIWRTAAQDFEIGRITGGAGSTDVSGVAGNTYATDLYVAGNGNVGIGTTGPSSRLEVNGRTTTTNFTMTNGATNGYVLQSNATGVATWVDPTTLAVTGDNLGNHTATTNLDMNSRDIVFTTGNQSMPTGNLGFGSTTRQMLNLWGSSFGIGVQSSTQYFRSNNNFAWFRGGVHSNTAYDPGAGGNRLMALNNSGLEVQARTTTTNFTMTNGATNGYVLQSNAAGDASWVDPTTFSAANIYNTNGTLTGNRAVTQNNFDLNFDANTLVVDGSANRVGIGTAAPDGKLNINSNGIAKGLNIDTDQDSRGAITIRRTDNANEIGVGFQNSGDAYGSVIFHRDQNDTDDLDEALSIATIGNENNPALLGETATFKNDGTIRFHDYGTGANDDASPARILGVQADGDLIEVNSSTLTQNIYNTDGTLTGNRAVTLGTNDLNFDANTLVVDGSANRVGIGNANPNAPLTIGTTSAGSRFVPDLRVGNGDGNTNSTLVVGQDATNQGFLSLSQSSGFNRSTLTINSGADDANSNNMFIDVSDINNTLNMRFEGSTFDLDVANNSTNISALNPGGRSDIFMVGTNIGINEAVPTASLDVDGNVRVRTLPSGAASDVVVTADGNGNLRQRTAAQIVAAGGGGAPLGDAWGVSGEDQSSNILRTGDVTISNDNKTALTIQTSNNSNANGIAFQNSGSAYSWNLYREDAGSNNANLVFSGGTANGNIDLLPERLRIQQNGNIAIGGHTPSSKLDVQTSARSGTHATGRPLYVTHNMGSAFNGIEFRHSNGTQGLGFGSNSIYGAGSSTVNNVNLMPKGAGGVGIGTTTPNSKLSVLDVNNSADYAGNLQVDIAELCFRTSDFQTTNPDFSIAMGGLGFYAAYTADFDRRKLGGVYGQIGSNQSGHLIFTTMSAGSELERMTITEGGNVGIGTNAPSQRLHVVGNIFSTGTVTTSDSTLKNQIHPISSGASQLIASLNPVSYKWKQHLVDTAGYDDVLQLGLLAQEVKKLIPEAVSGEEGKGMGIDYNKITPVMIKAMQEQQNEIKAQQQRIEKLEAELKAIKELLAK